VEILNWATERMTRREAAEYLGLAPATLQVWASTGRYSLPFVKSGVGRSIGGQTLMRSSRGGR
jgi:predicted site-specific integrase-resolvase